MDPIGKEIEAYICVDIEASGPNPGRYSLLSIGACTIAAPRKTFYVELKPINGDYTAEAMLINQLSLERLAQDGLPPEEAMRSLVEWLQEVVPPSVRPIFVAYNAPFDWMFVNDYFHRYLGFNPFGHTALDMKALYMGIQAVPWSETSLRLTRSHYLDAQSLTHHALQDAIDEADLFVKLLEDLRLEHKEEQ